MIGEKPNRRNYHRSDTLTLQYAQGIADIWLQPRLRGGAAAALIGQFPPRQAQRLGDQPSRLAQLADIAAVLRHAQRDAMRREDDDRCRPLWLVNRCQRR